MKILTFNCRGVVSLGKKLTLHRLVESTQPDILCFRKPWGILSRWSPFWKKSAKVGTLLVWILEDARGGLAIGWHSRSIKLINDWGFDSGLRNKSICGRIGFLSHNSKCLRAFPRPYSFWDNLFNKSFLKTEDLILGGDLNFSLGPD
jgi:hypothetical protein